jgi:cation diffusion facilitator family transporter
VGTAALQASVAWTSGSVALLGDSVHNLSDALTALPLLLAFRLARRPPNPRFTYGYGRAEDVAGVVVVLMILGSALLAAVEAVRRLLEPQPVHHLLAVAAAAVVGCIGNEVVAGYRIRSGHRIGSAALVADGLHARTDGLTSLAVLIGVAGSALGWRLADPVVGLVITVAILGVARSAVREVGGRLLDAVDPLLVDGARGALLAGEEIHSVHDLRLRWIGHRLHAEARVAVAPQLDVAAMTDLTRAAEHRLRGRLPLLERLSLQVVADA